MILAQLFKVDYKYIAIISINDHAADWEFLYLYIWNLFKKILFKKSLSLEEKLKAKFNSEYLFSLATLEIQ